MKTKAIIVTALLLGAATGAKAQVDVTKVDATHYTFEMPAYDVEVTTELWYKLSETATDNQANYGTKTDVFLERTLQPGGWNTFCAPFDVTIQSGWTVKKFTGATLSGSTLTLNFADETTKIEAGVPYLIKVETAYDFTADGHEFTGITQDWTAHDAHDTDNHAIFKPALTPVAMTANDKKTLFIAGGNRLAYPNANASLKAFRAYFELGHDVGAPTAFTMDFGDGETTGIQLIENAPRVTEDSSTYDLQGRKVENTTQKGVYIQNGKKVVIK